MIELYHEWNSVHSFKVRVVLNEKALDWTSRVIELLKFEHLQPAYLAINPDGVVPTLIHDGRRFHDSSPICEYLDEVHAQSPLQPAATAARHAVRRWLKYHDDVVHPALRDASFELLYKPILAAMPRGDLHALVARHPRPERRAKFLDGAASSIDWDALIRATLMCEAIAQRIDVAAQRSTWLEGDAFTLADVAMAPFAERIENLGMEDVWGDLPAGAAWAERVLGRASVAASRAPAAHRLAHPSPGTVAELRRRRAAWRAPAVSGKDK